MEMNSINLMTQPSEETSPSKEEILHKLQHLVDEDSSNKGPESNNNSISNKKTNKVHEKIEDIKYDNDDFGKPKGKIPLDGNFSTKEIEGLVEIAKEENLLDENVEVNIVKPNEVIGDKIKISDSPETE